MNAPTRRSLVRFLISYAAAGGRSDFVDRTQREIEAALADDERRVDELERRVATIEAINGITYPLAGGATLNAEAAAALDRDPALDDIAEALDRDLALDEIADELVQLLFTNGQGNQAARLELVDADGRGVGGWGPGPVRDRVLEALRKATPPAPAVLEAIQDEEAILRLAHAFRALGRAVEWDESPTVHDVAAKLADYLENPTAARQAIELADDRNRRTRRTR